MSTFSFSYKCNQRLRMAKKTGAATFLFLLSALLSGVAFSQIPGTGSQTGGARVWVTPAPGDASRGKALYEQTCISCHSIDAHKIGPAHRGVFGRRAGSAEGYKYSAVMANSRFRWTAQSLNAWLTYPEDLIAGQRMNVEVEKEQDRADLIAYLMTLK